MTAVSAPIPFGGTHRSVPKNRKCRRANDDGVVTTIDDSTSVLNVVLPTNDSERTRRSPESHSCACASAGTNIARDTRAAATHERIAGTAGKWRRAEVPFTAPREVRPRPAGEAIIMDTTRRSGGADT